MTGADLSRPICLHNLKYLVKLSQDRATPLPGVAFFIARKNRLIRAVDLVYFHTILKNYQIIFLLPFSERQPHLLIF